MSERDSPWRRISNRQIEEWLESPVTAALYERMEAFLEAAQSVSINSLIHFGEPQLTQEALIGDLAERNQIENFMAVLKGDFTIYETDEIAETADGKSLWDYTEGEDPVGEATPDRGDD